MKTIDKSAKLDSLDPQLAWEAWTPSADEPWNLSRSTLLYRRAGFGSTAAEAELALKQTPREVIDRLMGKDGSAAAKTFEADSGELAKSVLGTSEMQRLASWWLHRMLNTPTPLVEKMTLFWHGHFATGAEKVQDVELMYNQNQLLRQHALGDFKQMVQGIAKDAAMLIYLDSISNRKAHANENFARELMELFCLGEGNYTEADVQQLAKCFTGWEIRRKQFRFNPYQHDDSMKSLLGNENIESGEAAVDCVIASPHMPRFIVRKLFRFFVSEDVEPTDAFLEPLAIRFAESDYKIEAVVRTILESRLLLSGWSSGRKVRSPIELMIGWMRTVQCTTNMAFLTNRLRSLGQSVLFPPNVKGWEGGRAWINSSTLIGRANLIYELVRHENSRFDGEPLQAYAVRNGVRDSNLFLAWFGTHFLTAPLSEAEQSKLAGVLAKEPTDQWANATMIELARLPRIHLS